MRILNIVATSTLAGLLLATTVSTADAARWERRGPPIRGIFGAVGALVVGAATIATLPFAIAAGAARAATPAPAYYPNTRFGYYPPPPPAYVSPPAYYAPPPASTWYGAPPAVYGQSTAPGYYYPPQSYNYPPGY